MMKGPMKPGCECKQDFFDARKIITEARSSKAGDRC